MRVIVVRHGEAEGNVQRIVESRSHGRLTYYGMEQAQKIAYQLRAEPIAVVYSSNLQRCVDTALFIADHHPYAALVPTHQLRERDQGMYEGGSYDAVPYEQFEGDFLHRAIPGGESWRDVERRLSTFLNEIYIAHPDSTVLLVTHTGPSKAVRALLGAVPLRNAIDQRVEHAQAYYFMMNGLTQPDMG